MFLLRKFRPCVIKQMIFPRAGFPVRCSLMKTLHLVSRTLSALEMNLTSSFLFLSDQLEYGVHLPLSSVLLLLPVSLKLWVFENSQNFPFVHVHTVVLPTFFVILHLQDPSLQCFSAESQSECIFHWM